MAFTLDDIRAAADKKFGSFDYTLQDGTPVELKNVLRMEKGHRARVKEAQASFEASGENEDEGDEDGVIEAVRTLIRAIVNQDYLADRLLDELGDDPGILMSLISAYSGSEELGEASASQS